MTAARAAVAEIRSDIPPVEVRDSDADTEA